MFPPFPAQRGDAEIRTGRRRGVLILAVGLPLALSQAGSVRFSIDHPAGTQAEPSSGPHDATSHHSFEDVQRWVSVFDDPDRDLWQKPTEVVRQLGLKPGQKVADLGAGTGYFLKYLSAVVGDQGTVWALDTEPNMVGYMKSRVAKEGLKNVRPQLCPADSPGLPSRSADLFLIVDTYHHIDDRLNYLGRLQRALAPGGRVAIVDFRKDVDPPPGPPREHRLDRKIVVSEFEQAGWKLVEDSHLLRPQYFLIFQPRDPTRR